MRAIIFLLALFIISCETPEGHIGASKDISEAKKRGVFFSAYAVSPNPYKMNDSLQLTVKEAWIEQHWGHGANDQTIPLTGFQLCINTIKSDEDKINYPYNTIGIDRDHYLRESGVDSYLGDLDSIPVDTIEYIVQRGNNLMDDSTQKKEIIGKLILIRK